MTLPQLIRQVADSLPDHGVRALVLDDINRLRIHRADDQDVLDLIRALMGFQVTLVLTGVNIPGLGLLREARRDAKTRQWVLPPLESARVHRLEVTQTERRFEMVELDRFRYDTPQAIQDFTDHLQGIEDHLRLLKAKKGMLTSRNMPEYLTRRSGGVVGPVPGAGIGAEPRSAPPVHRPVGRLLVGEGRVVVTDVHAEQLAVSEELRGDAGRGCARSRPPCHADHQNGGITLATSPPAVSGRISAMTTDIRRAAGTRTLSDVLLSMFGIRRLNTEKDLADLQAGSTLQVFCSSPTLGTVKMLPIGKGRTVPHASSGHLYLTADTVTWRNRRTGENVAFGGPFRLSPSEQKIPHPKLARFDLLAGDEQHVIVIPKADVALVTRVLEAADRQHR
jgi:hypothetical protein